MTTEQIFSRLMDKCDIYFENYIISKEYIIRKYAEFFALSLKEDRHTVLVAQHTGSVCFDVISFLIATLGCIILNETESDDIIRSLEDGQMVMLFTGNKKERRIWRGFVQRNRDGAFITDDTNFENADFVCLEQPEQHTKTFLPREQWNRISPYKGTSKRTDGRGIRKTKSNRNDFISFLFDVPVASVSSVIAISNENGLV